MNDAPRSTERRSVRDLEPLSGDMDHAASGSGVPGIGTRAALLSIVGFWLFYFAIVTLRSAVLGFDDQIELLWRRAGVSLASMGVTVIFWQLLRRTPATTLKQRIGVAALLALPASIIYSTANWYAFAALDDQERQRIVVTREDRDQITTVQVQIRYWE